MSKLVDVNRKSEQEHALDRLVDEVIRRCEKPQDLLRDGGILSLLTKKAIERMMNAELDYHLNDENNPESGRTAGNARSGTGRKTIKGDFGEVEIRTPRDRLSTFEPQIVPRRQRRVEKIDKALWLSMPGA